MRTDSQDVLAPETKRYRTLFVSDLHLGTKACQAEAFLDFLRHADADRIYLVGDIVDFWRIRRGAYWPQDQMAVHHELSHALSGICLGAAADPRILVLCAPAQVP